jgi:hypothetical protein
VSVALMLAFIVMAVIVVVCKISARTAAVSN